MGGSPLCPSFDGFDGKVGEGTREGLLCLEIDFLEREKRSSKEIKGGEIEVEEV